MRAFWLFLVTACSLNVDYDGTNYQCNPDGTCPTDYECVDMVCVPSDPVPPACSKDVSAGGAHACAVRNDNTVWCWGRNDFGQLGDGSAVDSDIPVQVANVMNIVKVQAGELFTCALDDMGQVWCWGNNGAGQLGDGTNSDSRTAVQVRDVSGATQLAVGTEHACVLRGDGSIACWGYNDDGQLGDGSMTARNTPTAVTLPGAASFVSAGNDITCAALTDGSAQCWGENNDGELGVGDTAAHTRPAPVAAVSDIAQIAAGSDFTCFMTKFGFVYCAGLNEAGQLGTGNLTSSSTPQRTPIPVRALSIDAGSSHACIRDEVDGTWCWGNGGSGRLLDAGYDRKTLAVRGLLSDVQAVSSGGEHTCALDADGAIRCAGFNRRGQLGDGRPVTRGAPVQVDGVENAVMLAAGARHTCAAQADGLVLCWGENNEGEAGNGSYVGAQTTPHVVYGVASPKQMVAGTEHTCALLDSGVTFCWGNNDSGRLGDGTQTSSAQPRELLVNGATSIVAGDNSSCALINGSARCFGQGFGPTTIMNIAGISPGDEHVCTLETDKTVQCYGENFNYQLGDGTQNAQSAPGVTAMGVTNASEIHTRGDQSCALLGDGTIKCWGLNADGRLGVGNTNYQIRTPTAVQGISNVMKFAMGFDASCAIKTDGTLWCWGASYFGQVGDGSYQSRPAAVQMLSLTGAKDVAAGGAHTCAIDSAGHVVCWGLGASGQLGNGIREIVRPVGVRMTCP
jgi:alpha-tubulin suppressor-like RCC1 family protein